jgi:cysteinyl-tRNA synthetase
MEALHLYNTFTREKERFEPLNPPAVGLYLCGPTVYGDAHLGHARPAITFDVLFRYLKHLGYKVRYVRNITDVGHLENDADEGEDKIAKKARVEQLEPMEIAQFYTNRYNDNLRQLNVLPPSIEPKASGHIPEQIKMISQIIDNGFAYVSNGSVYLDVVKYSEHYPYGKLSGRENIEEMLSGSRELEGQAEKKNNVDFALWKKASPEHIMRWESPWSEGFPGWHIECSAMSTKYLGNYFDIHGGGMDLKFPHHEGEIAQTNACFHHEAPTNQAKVWMHCNMITINGQKMGKSLGNFITLEQFFSGDHPLVSQAFSPMAIRFFILQSHYRSTLDFSSEAITAADKGMKRLFHAIQLLNRIVPAPYSSVNVEGLKTQLYAALNDDLNTAMAIAHLFDAATMIHALDQKEEKISAEDLKALQTVIHEVIFDILGLHAPHNARTAELEGTIQVLIKLRQEARAAKDFKTSDIIRDQLKVVNIQLNDGPEGTNWEFIDK